MATNVGIVRVSLEDLTELLQLPSDHHLVRIVWDEFVECVSFMVEGPSMPRKEKFQEMQRLDARITKDGLEW